MGCLALLLLVSVLSVAAAQDLLCRCIGQDAVGWLVNETLVSSCAACPAPCACRAPPTASPAQSTGGAVVRALGTCNATGCCCLDGGSTVRGSLDGGAYMLSLNTHGGRCGAHSFTASASGLLTAYRSCVVLHGLLGSDWLIDTWNASEWRWAALGCGYMATAPLASDAGFLIAMGVLCGVCAVAALVALVCVWVRKRRSLGQYTTL